MLVTSVTTAAGDIAIINQLNVVFVFNIFVQTGPNLDQIYILAVSSIIACATLHSITRAITWKKEISRETLKRGSKHFTEENASSFSQWSHRINHKSSKWHVSAFFGSYVSNITAIKCFRYTTFQFKPTFPFLYFCISWYLVKLNNSITTCKIFISIWVWVCLTDYKCYGIEWMSEHKNSKMILHTLKRKQICKCV